jgi:ATP-dependent Lhr-like helicase
MSSDPRFVPATVFSAPTLAWLQQAFAAYTPVQVQGWPVVAGGAHTLLAAPTGNGKTLAAFLWGIDTLVRLEADAPPGVRVLYVSPLKALVYDVERNLRGPLAGIRAMAQRQGVTLRDIRVDVRTGDTPQPERRRQGRLPADILVTTPESLFLLLGSRARDTLARVHTVIVDELHVLAPSKRGAHLALSLERLEESTSRPPQRIGLSATVRPLDSAARFLAGNRPVELVDAASPPHLDLKVVVPVPDMANPPPPPPQARHGPLLAADFTAADPPPERGLWPSIYPRLLEEIRTARSTIVFVNSRGLCERLVQGLNAMAGEPLVLAHHGSLSWTCWPSSWWPCAASVSAAPASCWPWCAAPGPTGGWVRSCCTGCWTCSAVTTPPPSWPICGRC